MERRRRESVSSFCSQIRRKTLKDFCATIPKNQLETVDVYTAVDGQALIEFGVGGWCFF